MKKAIAIFFIICFGVMILIEGNLCTWCNPDKEQCPFSTVTETTDPPVEEAAGCCASSCASPCAAAQPVEQSPCEMAHHEPFSCGGYSKNQKKTYTTPCGKVIVIESEEEAPICASHQEAEPVKEEATDTPQKCSSCPLYGKSGGCPTCILAKMNAAMTFQFEPNVRLIFNLNTDSKLENSSLVNRHQVFTLNYSGVHPTISSTVLRC